MLSLHVLNAARFAFAALIPASIAWSTHPELCSPLCCCVCAHFMCIPSILVPPTTPALLVGSVHGCASAHVCVGCDHCWCPTGPSLLHEMPYSVHTAQERTCACLDAHGFCYMHKGDFPDSTAAFCVPRHTFPEILPGGFASHLANWDSQSLIQSLLSQSPCRNALACALGSTHTCACLSLPLLRICSACSGVGSRLGCLYSWVSSVCADTAWVVVVPCWGCLFVCCVAKKWGQQASRQH